MINISALPAVSIGSMTVAIADLVALAIVLVFFIVGLVKGFSKQILAVLGLAAAIIVSILSSKYVAKFLIEKLPSVRETILGWYQDKTTANIPAFMQGFVNNITHGEENALPDLFTDWTMLAISFILTFIVSFLIFKLIKFIISKIVDSNPKIKSTDVFLGGLLGIIKAILILIFLWFILGLFGISLDCVDGNGEPVRCILNEVLTWIMDQKVVANIFESIFSFIANVTEQLKNVI